MKRSPRHSVGSLPRRRRPRNLGPHWPTVRRWNPNHNQNRRATPMSQARKTALQEQESEREADGDSDGSDEPAAPALHCKCGHPARIFTAGQSTKPHNRGRRFAKCATGGCDFFTPCESCDTAADRQQAFNDAEDARLESQQDHEDGDDGSEKSAADDNDLWARYGEDYDDGIGDAGQYDVDN
ncbi:hypothetical protein B0H17DRAFT_547435 [Mycena rosella]|uniref:Uncharacterized protein n=1 Tax=Mycena rosella TaxID=1033263 RepID=A0AAD7DIM4_MYCRO|nr:hypothetical protein B0H17DRAFT_547435 [Mycena rosella]